MISRLIGKFEAEEPIVVAESPVFACTAMLVANLAIWQHSNYRRKLPRVPIWRVTNMDGKSPRFQMRSSVLKLLDMPALAANFSFVMTLAFMKCIGSALIQPLAERQNHGRHTANVPVQR